jgi:hypothetical protein
MISKKLDNEYLYRTVISEKTLEGNTIEMNKKSPVVLNLGNVIGEQETEIVKVNLGKIDQPVKIKKLLEPEKLYSPVKQKTINMGYVYENESYNGNIFVPKLKNDKKEEEPREVERMRIEKEIRLPKPMPEINIYENVEIEPKQKLHGENIEEEQKKEKKGLDNERLR